MKRIKGAHRRIKEAMLANERAVLSLIRQSMKEEGRPYHPCFANARTWNALDRLVAKGKIRYTKSLLAGGYVEVEPRRRAS